MPEISDKPVDAVQQALADVRFLSGKRDAVGVGAGVDELGAEVRLAVRLAVMELDERAA